MLDMVGMIGLAGVMMQEHQQDLENQGVLSSPSDLDYGSTTGEELMKRDFV